MPLSSILPWAAASLAAGLASGCARRDECAEIYDKLAATSPTLMSSIGITAPRADWVSGCRPQATAVREQPILKCVLGAKDDAAVDRCVVDGIMQRGEEPDAKSDFQLMNLGTPFKEHHRRTGAFPKGQAGPTPRRACCASPDHRCPVSDEWATDPIWRSVGVAITEPTYAQFSYESDGTRVVLSATYDAGCAGKPVTSRSMIEVSADGKLRQHWADDHH